MLGCSQMHQDMRGEQMTDLYGFSNVLGLLHRFNLKCRMEKNLCKNKF